MLYNTDGRPGDSLPLLVRALTLVTWGRYPAALLLATLLTSVAAAVLFFKPIRDSQSGMWVFRRAALPRMRLTSDGMAFSEEIKLEALLQRLRFGEEHVPYGARVGEVKLQKWRDGWRNLTFLVRKRFGLV